MPALRLLASLLMVCLANLPAARAVGFKAGDVPFDDGDGNDLNATLAEPIAAPATEAVPAI